MKIINKTKWISYTALLTALTAVATIIIQVPSVDGGYTNLSDAVIFITAILMDPVAAMLVGGLGTFLADLLIYPATMLYSLAFHGIEGLVVGLLVKLLPKKTGKIRYVLQSVYMLIGGLLMMIGYYFAKAYLYGTPASALISLWRNALQVGISIVVANVLLYPVKLSTLINSDAIYERKNKTQNEQS